MLSTDFSSGFHRDSCTVVSQTHLLTGVNVNDS